MPPIFMILMRSFFYWCSSNCDTIAGCWSIIENVSNFRMAQSELCTTWLNCSASGIWDAIICALNPSDLFGAVCYSGRHERLEPSWTSTSEALNFSSRDEQNSPLVRGRAEREQRVLLEVASRALGHEREQWLELLALVAISGHTAIWQILQGGRFGTFWVSRLAWHLA